MTEKENVLLVLKGEQPAWVPRYGMGKDPNCDVPPAFAAAMPDVLMRKKGPDGKLADIFGVEYTAAESIGGMALPTPGKFILHDITKWRDVIKTPDLSGVDWEQVAKKATKDINRNEVLVTMGTHVGYFQHLMNFMGFTEGLCAMLEEPEEVYALMEYLSDFYVGVYKELVRYIKPDIMGITDDTATALNPFISLDMYRRLIKPFHVRLADIANNDGIYINMHNCGRCEDFIDDWRDFNVLMWNPAQLMNDLVGIKKKYGNSLVMVGCWDSSGPVSWQGASEELVRSEVRKCIDTYAPGGGFIFWGSAYGYEGDPEVKRRAAWISDEVYKYGHQFYK